LEFELPQKSYGGAFQHHACVIERWQGHPLMRIGGREGSQEGWAGELHEEEELSSSELGGRPVLGMCNPSF
jgi:hypothetical protein